MKIKSYRAIGSLFISFVFFVSTDVGAWDAKKRLTYFEAANQEARMCGRVDLFTDWSRRVQVEYNDSIESLHEEGVSAGLSDVDAKYYVVKAAEKIRNKVATDHLPYMYKNKSSICDAIENRFVMFFNLMTGD